MDNHRKRHCMVVLAYYPLGETRVQREAEALLKSGYEVDVICMRGAGEPAHDTFKGVNIYRLPMERTSRALVRQSIDYLKFFCLAMFKVAALHWQRRYNTVQVHNLPDFLIFAAWIPKLMGAGTILDLHDLMPEFYQGRFGRAVNSLPVRLIRWQENLSCRFADHVITVSHHWRQALIQRGVPADKVSVVMNVADDTIFHRHEPRAIANDNTPGLKLIYHGMITQRYGLDLVLQAMAKLRDTAPNLNLTLLGEGDHLDTLIAMTKELHLEKQVIVRRGLISAEELPAVILQADAGVVPYRNDAFTDGLVPTKLLEYAALGMPAIASCTTSIAHYFQDTLVEFFTPGDVDDLAQGMLKLYNDHAYLARLAQGAEKFNQRYNWAKISADYVTLVERVGHVNYSDQLSSVTSQS